MRAQIQAITHAGAGPFRSGDGLTRAVAALGEVRTRFQTDLPATLMPQVAEWETSNVLASASILTEAALAREESRGGHQRTDFPETDDANYKVRIGATLDPDGALRLTRVPLEV